MLRTFNNTNNNNTKQIGSNDDKQCRIHRDNTTKKNCLLLNPRAKRKYEKKKKTETCEASKNRHFFFLFCVFFFLCGDKNKTHTHTQNRTNFSVLRLKKKKIDKYCLLPLHSAADSYAQGLTFVETESLGYFFCLSLMPFPENIPLRKCFKTVFRQDLFHNFGLNSACFFV